MKAIGFLAQILRNVRPSRRLKAIRARLKRWNAVLRWRQAGRPVPPPPEVKHATIVEYAKRFGLDVLVETGTYQGDTINATQRAFTDIYSIELSPELHKRSQERFGGVSKIHLLLGDSGTVLKSLLPLPAGVPLFWLDAHYSGGVTVRGTLETPILQELEAIFASCPNAVVLIDDARMFVGDNSYPTLEELEAKVQKGAPHWAVEVKDDIIRLYPAAKMKL